ncbi:hypothetical protein TIFTF001_051780 [Ficus carica]|uniref:Uncharacterized protein n=1 Tax=Ficus carica TaxID=3494 RepID=A0AA88JBU0_FICCA|nr:hypothetical protein TIFTF001_051780 [Ficus carica]
MEIFAFGLKMDEQALEPGTDEIRGKHGTAQANTSRPEEARLRLPDPGHNLPRDGEPLASPFLASPSCLLT